MISTIVALRVLFILGIVNVVTGLLIFFSCRCLPGSGIGRRLMKYKWYQSYFKWHCYIWWIFWAVRDCTCNICNYIYRLAFLSRNNYFFFFMSGR